MVGVVTHEPKGHFYQLMMIVFGHRKRKVILKRFSKNKNATTFGL
jgi:hypothetical protein